MFEDKDLWMVSGSAPSEEAPKSQVRHSSQAAGLRQRTKNTLHLCCSVLLNPDIQSRSRLIFRLAAPIREWHGHGVSRQRSKEASGMYYAHQAQGECVDSVSRTFRQLSDLECLEFIGLKCIPTPAWKGLALDSAAVMSEDKLASEAATFCLRLVNRRMQSMLGYFMGFPGLFALLIPNLPGLDQILLKRMREAAAAHRGMATAP